MANMDPSSAGSTVAARLERTMMDCRPARQFSPAAR